MTGCLSERLKQYCHGVVSTDSIDLTAATAKCKIFVGETDAEWLLLHNHQSSLQTRH